MRLAGWYTQRIWSVPLVWVLLLAYGFIVLGFALVAIAPITHWSPFLALHAFTVGGMGLMTMGMMARVALGHTGRDVAKPAFQLAPLFSLLAAAGIARVVLPVFMPGQYLLLIIISQALWMLAFAGFVVYFARVLVGPRVDGKPG